MKESASNKTSYLALLRYTPKGVAVDEGSSKILSDREIETRYVLSFGNTVVCLVGNFSSE